MEVPGTPVFTRSPAWSRVLENIEAALAQVLEETTRREQSLTQPPSIPDGDREARWRQSLADLGQRLMGLQALADRAAAEVAEADALLVSCEEALQRWRETAERTAENLAEGASRAV
jgi:hypothetical protein